MTYLRQFGRFLYDFLVGDAWELFVGPLVALVIVWAAIQVGLDGVAAGVLLFVLVLGVAAINLTIALRGSA
jgi:ABC-type uncharacterized transport system permease subunit